MKKKVWTEAEIKFLTENRLLWTARELGRHLNRSVVSVQQRIARLPKLEKAEEAAIPPLVAEDVSLIDFWRKEAGTANRKLAEQSREKTAVDLLVEKAVELAPISYQPPKMARLPAKRGKGSPQSAVLVFSDTHVGAVVSPDQTLGLGNYSFDVFLKRLAQLERTVFSILQDHVTTPVPEIVIPVLGDMIDGGLDHCVESGQPNLIFEQIYSAGHAIAQFFRNLSTIAPLRIYTVSGNHSRFQHQKKQPNYNRFSSFDMMLYAYVEALLRDVPTIKFHLDKQPFSLFSVQGFNFYCAHGENIKGGDIALGIPSHSLGRHLSNTVQNFSAAGKPLPSFYIYGHRHKPVTLPHAGGDMMINGAFVGIDGFSLASAFNSSRPSQKFFLIHPRYGKAASYDIRLDLGDETPHHYQLPEKFLCK